MDAFFAFLADVVCDVVSFFGAVIVVIVVGFGACVGVDVEFVLDLGTSALRAAGCSVLLPRDGFIQMVYGC